MEKEKVLDLIEENEFMWCSHYDIIINKVSITYTNYFVEEDGIVFTYDGITTSHIYFENIKEIE